ncbi:MAG TPA: FliM/FliN family flagellar motor switch protein [Bryobacteraceae bacterium]|jgi:flagellar motor switch protein FliN/FliY|nr:FliM/FliN family flagellar motor switch protein [Bryobacteraceae bacterium]
MSALEEIAFLADVPISIEVELDKKVMSLGEILQLREGGVIRMTRSAGENIDILIGGTLAAYGEIVIIEETVGVRLTDFKVQS